MEQPIYVPTSIGPMAAVASLPFEGDLVGPPLLWLPGGDNPRTRNTVGLEIARRSAELGRPTLRIDYPGSGLTPGEKVSDPSLVPVLGEIATWFRTVCEMPKITVAGTCRGAALALAMAANDPAVDRVIAVAPPVRSRKRGGRRVRAGVAALDPVGSRFVKAIAGSGSKPATGAWMGSVLESLEAAVRSSQVHVILGQEDRFHADFVELQESSLLPDEVFSRIDLIVRSGVQLYGFTKITDMEWLRDTVLSLLQPEEAYM